MDDKVVVVSQPLLKPLKIVKWKVSEGNSISVGCVILLYNTNEVDNIETLKLKSTQAGIVYKIIAQEKEVIKFGGALLELKPCIHPTVMRDMCAECGTDLRRDDIITSASIPMIHSVPELKVSLEIAKKLGKADTERLLKDKKLVLLVDLDQTLIHTTNDNIPPNLKDVHHFQLYGPNSPWYHTRLRPGTHEFLAKMSLLYELHICTFGARNYAHMIAMLLDRDGQLFSHRILSRDECFNPNSKTANLKALFPCGDNMVCIIDDREDVWSYASNLIHVKPYHFFQHTGDINAPPGLDKHENDDKDGVDLTKMQENNKSTVKPNDLNVIGESKQIIENISCTNETEDTIKKVLKKEQIKKNISCINDNEETIKIDEKSEQIDKNKNSFKEIEETIEMDEKNEKINKNIFCTNDINKTIKIEKGDEQIIKNSNLEKMELNINEVNKIKENISDNEVEKIKMESENTILKEDINKIDDANNKIKNIKINDVQKTEKNILPNEKIEMKEECKSEDVENETNETNLKNEKIETMEEFKSETVENESNESNLKNEKIEILEEYKSEDVKNTSNETNSTNETILNETQKPDKNINMKDHNDNKNEKISNELIEIEDPDDYLIYLEEILRIIHNAFYERFEKMDAGEVPDLKKIIPEVRSNVLKGKRLVFSGLVPTHMKLEESKAYQVAKSLGATVTQDLESNTTHLVAVRPGTAKVNVGRRKKNLKIITPDWLWSCAERWEHVDERLYPLNNKGSKNRHPPPHCSSPEHIQNYEEPPIVRKRTPSGRFMDTINPLMSFSSADIADMDREVEDIFNESESEGESNKITVNDKKDILLEKLKKPNESDDDSSSSDESLTGEHPHGWNPTSNQKKRNREDQEQELEDESTADEYPSAKFRRGEELPSDLEIGGESNSEGSIDAPDEIDDGDWNMMGAALEREFLSNN